MTDLLTEPTVSCKRPNNEPPYLSWCLVVRNCDKTLENTLRSLRERTPNAEIVIVDTCSSDETVTISQRYADVWVEYRGPEGKWTKEDYAVDDMAAARQHSFELASGTWRGWVDGDDKLLGAEEGKRFLEINGKFMPKRPGFTEEHHTAEDPNNPKKPIELEDFLRWLENNRPEMTCIWCPYLYQRDPNTGSSIVWQERERIVKWIAPKLKGIPTRLHGKPLFRWSEAAHEVLVPNGNYLPPRAELPHLLWLHEKVFSGPEYEYSLKRHSAIMLKQYEAGDVTNRRCRYLANFAHHLFPERELEFLEAAHRVAWTTHDRYRALIDLGNYYARRGFYFDSKEKHGAAIELYSHMPDVFYAAGTVAFDNEDWDRAVLMLRKGVTCDIPPQSEVNPRDHKVKYPTILSMALQRAADTRIESGAYDDALSLLHEAMQHADTVRQASEVGKDSIEAQSYFLKARNKFNAHKAAMELKEIWEYLRNNDEPQKALALLEAFPHNAEEHPILRELEKKAAPIQTHIESPAAYRDFYNAVLETGYVPMEPMHYTMEYCHPRVFWTVNWLKDNVAAKNPKARVLDIGCCDGICGIPLLMTCEGIEYQGVDICAPALDNFTKMLDFHKIKDQARVSLKLGTEPHQTQEASFDVVIAGEIIEHVPDPVAWLGGLKKWLKPPGSASQVGGVILVSTPWGSFDEGAPPPTTHHGTERDSRGHLRAYSARQAYEDCDAAGYHVEALSRVGKPTETGHAMLLVLRPKQSSTSSAGPPIGRPIAVSVCGALWNWNGSTIDREGIGASEEMIVRLGEYLAREGREYNVYGPVPEDEVYKGVGYFKRETIRKLSKHQGQPKLLVSRAPGFIRTVDEWVGEELPAVLWLQDTTYPDLDQEIADRFESIVTVSQWHKELTLVAHGLSPETADKIKVIYNFVQREHFQDGLKIGWEGIKKPYHFIYASSPDRGLLRLLKIWPRIIDLWPEATLSIFYGWRGASKLGGGMDAGWNKRYLESRREYEKLRFQKGVQEVGLVNHYQIALEFQRASIWSYPSDFAETCLHEDSMVSVPGDHRTMQPVRVPIKELAGKSGLPVYCFDEKEERFRVGTMLRCWQTKVVEELVELELDDGRCLRLTPDHMVMNFDREWVRADSLVVGSRLTALHFRYRVMVKDGDGTWEDESKVVVVRHIRGNFPVYDMEVADFHTFVAEGVIVHNCCTNALKARSAGCIPVTSAFAALNETASCPQARLLPLQENPTKPPVYGPDYDDRFIEAIKEVIDTPLVERKRMAEECLEQFSFEAMKPRWLEVLE